MPQLSSIFYLLTNSTMQHQSKNDIFPSLPFRFDSENTKHSFTPKQGCELNFLNFMRKDGIICIYDRAIEGNQDWSRHRAISIVISKNLLSNIVYIFDLPNPSDIFEVGWSLEIFGRSWEVFGNFLTILFSLESSEFHWNISKFRWSSLRTLEKFGPP